MGVGVVGGHAATRPLARPPSLPGLALRHSERGLCSPAVPQLSSPTNPSPAPPQAGAGSDLDGLLSWVDEHGDQFTEVEVETALSQVRAAGRRAANFAGAAGPASLCCPVPFSSQHLPCKGLPAWHACTWRAPLAPAHSRSPTPPRAGRPRLGSLRAGGPHRHEGASEQGCQGAAVWQAGLQAADRCDAAAATAAAASGAARGWQPASGCNTLRHWPCRRPPPPRKTPALSEQQPVCYVPCRHGSLIRGAPVAGGAGAGGAEPGAPGVPGPDGGAPPSGPTTTCPTKHACARARPPCCPPAAWLLPLHVRAHPPRRRAARVPAAAR